MGERRRDEESQAESRRILERVEQDSNILSGAATRARDHFAARDAKEEDWTELWGRRIGRLLGLAFAVALIVWLWSAVAGGG